MINKTQEIKPKKGGETKHEGVENNRKGKRKMKKKKKRTLETSKQVITNITSSVGTAMTIVDTEESTKRARFNLALVFKDLVGLNNSHGEVTGSIMTIIIEPK